MEVVNTDGYKVRQVRHLQRVSHSAIHEEIKGATPPPQGGVSLAPSGLCLVGRGWGSSPYHQVPAVATHYCES